MKDFDANNYPHLPELLSQHEKEDEQKALQRREMALSFANQLYRYAQLVNGTEHPAKQQLNAKDFQDLIRLMEEMLKGTKSALGTSLTRAIVEEQATVHKDLDYTQVWRKLGLKPPHE